MPALTINVISESEFTVQGHGVHTVFLEHVAALRAIPHHKILINSRENTDIVHAHTVGPYSWRALRRVPRQRRFITAHIIPDSLTGSLKGGKALHALSGPYLRWFYNQADTIIAVSQEVAQALVALGVRSAIIVIPNGVDTRHIRPQKNIRTQQRRHLKITLSAPVVIGNGQIQPRKRFDAFYRVASELPEIHFVWIGGIPFGRLGSGFQAMQKLIQTAPDNLQVTGIVDRTQALNLMQAGDVLFLPSTQENHPLAVIEAAALHLPIVLRDIPEYRSSFPTGVIYGNDDTFTSLITQLFDSPQHYSKHSQAAARLSQRYDVTALTHRLDQLYGEVMRSTKK